jgi:outer membrane immunogenic protein
MKKLLITSAALAALIGTPALAADMPVKAAPAPLVCPSCNWAGFYFGGNVGGSIGVVRTVDAMSGLPAFAGAVNPFLTVSDTRALPGAIGGGQIGFNWQSGNVVLGVEADWQASSEKSTLTGTWGSLTGGGSLILGSADEMKIRSIGTARARLGWAHDDFLWYVTGGGAWGNIQSNYTLTSNSPANTFASPALASFNTTKGGWTIGGGVETCLGWGVGNHWSAKLEYLYVNLGTVNNAFTTAVTAAGTFSPYTSSNKIEDHIIRVGLNYHL